jgi:hypothetical protein
MRRSAIVGLGFALALGLAAAASAGLVGLTKGADYGGRMVYDYNAGENACGQPIDFSR